MLMLHYKCRTNVKYDASFKHYIMSNNMNHYVEHLGKVKLKLLLRGFTFTFKSKS